MTRKHYEILAAALMRSFSQATEESIRDALEELACDLSGELEKDNPKFNTQRFLKACGVMS